jgi:hypothetical protein
MCVRARHRKAFAPLASSSRTYILSRIIDGMLGTVTFGCFVSDKVASWRRSFAICKKSERVFYAIRESSRKLSAAFARPRALSAVQCSCPRIERSAGSQGTAKPPWLKSATATVVQQSPTHAWALGRPLDAPNIYPLREDRFSGSRMQNCLLKRRYLASKNRYGRHLLGKSHSRHSHPGSSSIARNEVIGRRCAFRICGMLVRDACSMMYRNVRSGRVCTNRPCIL